MKEINPMSTSRAASWQLYIDAPMPMVTIFKTLNITSLMDLKAAGYKLNMLMCYCIACAASETPEFSMLPVGKKMIAYDQIGVNVIVANQNGGINSCDIPYSKELDEFDHSYLALTREVRHTCENSEIDNSMIIGTSSLMKYDIDGVVNMYSGIFNNPFFIWGKYRTDYLKTTLQVSFQFHHVQMDGMEACKFLGKLQKRIDDLAGK